VTIDLNGFRLHGGGVARGNGIQLMDGYASLTVRNGTIAGMLYGGIFMPSSNLEQFSCQCRT
jgi:hypothetical protein